MVCHNEVQRTRRISAVKSVMRVHLNDVYQLRMGWVLGGQRVSGVGERTEHDCELGWMAGAQLERTLATVRVGISVVCLPGITQKSGNRGGPVPSPRVRPAPRPGTKRSACLRVKRLLSCCVATQCSALSAI